MCPDNNLISFDYDFSDLINIEEFKKILDSFYKVTGIPNGLLSNNAEILSKSGWTDTCEFFHRINPQTKNNCLLNDKDWIYTLKEKEILCSTCKNGLSTFATPIVIEQHPIAILFLGQVLKEPLNIEYFKEQSLKYDFDEKAYLDTLEKIPVISKDKVESIMECIVDMAKVLTQSGISKFEKISVEKDLEKTIEEKVRLSDILKFSPNGIGWTNSNGKIEFVNEKFTKLFGYTLEEIPTLETFKNYAYHNTDYFENVINPWMDNLKVLLPNSVIPDLELNIKCKDDVYRRVLIKASFVDNKILVNFNDITEYYRSEQRNKSNKKILEMIAKGENLSDILYEIIKTVESEDLKSICSISLLDKQGKRLLSNIKNRLPDFYNEAINGIEIGVEVGSCGTTAFFKERVIVEDIMNHKYWTSYKEIAKKANLASCWSEPIISSTGQVFGTFTIYHDIIKKPTDADLERMVFGSNIASIAIENKKNQEKLEFQAYTDYLTGLRNRRAFIEQAETELYRSSRYNRKLSLIMFDIDYFKHINDTFGHSVGDLVLQQIANICKSILREIDIIGRIGGEEFAILLPETEIAEAISVAQRLCDTISEDEIIISLNKKTKYTASFGVVFTDSLTTVTVDELLNQADNALYQAKKSGRNRVCVFK